MCCRRQLILHRVAICCRSCLQTQLQKWMTVPKVSYKRQLQNLSILQNNQFIFLFHFGDDACLDAFLNSYNLMIFMGLLFATACLMDYRIQRFRWQLVLLVWYFMVHLVYMLTIYISQSKYSNQSSKETQDISLVLQLFCIIKIVLKC